MAIVQVGLFGGSFNPPHLGHQAIARYVLEEKKVDEVWVVPCFKHPFDKKLVSFKHRFNMCELGFSALGEGVSCLDIEKKLGGKSVTFRTVSHLKQKYPHRFYLVVGEDVAQEAKEWQNYEELQKQIEWLIIPRGAASPIPNISATEIREVLSQRKNRGNYLDKNVIEYIEKHGLYKNRGEI